MAARGPTAKAKGPGLEGAAAGIPEITAAAQPQTVDVAADRPGFRRTEDKLTEGIAVVHGVEEREASVDTRSGDQGKEGAVRSIVGVAVTAGVEVAAAEPR